MAPEYAMDGIFSVKSDVFSFGVMVLEIVSGQKIRGVYLSNPKFYLPEKARMISTSTLIPIQLQLFH